MNKLFTRILLPFFTLLPYHGSFAQAPNITYGGAKVVAAGAPIIPFVPINTGGAVPANEYGMVSTFAGNGTAGYTDGLAATASFNTPGGLVVDNAGNIYLADIDNHAIRKISPNGDVSTLAGDGTPGNYDNTGILAKLNRPVNVAYDGNGNLYVIDYGNNQIKKITTAGQVTTFAGSGAMGGQDGTGTGATFKSPLGITVDNDGNIVITDSGNFRIRKITPGGVVSAFTGITSQPVSKDGNTFTASFAYPISVVSDKEGNLFVAEFLKVRQISKNGSVTTFAGSGEIGYQDGQPANAKFNSISELCFDAAGNMYVADGNSHVIRRITKDGMVSTLAGNLAKGLVNGTAANARFDTPNDMDVDKAGNMYVSDSKNNVIRKISLHGYVIDKTLPPGLVFNNTTGVISGTPTSAWPATDYTIAAYNSSGNSVTVVNIKVNAVTTPNPNGPNISYTTPQAYIVNTAITPLAPANTGSAIPPNNLGTVSTYAGKGVNGMVNGDLNTATFGELSDFEFDAVGNMYVADRTNNMIRKITPAGLVSTLAGSNPGGYTDGPGIIAKFTNPSALSVDNAGNVYVSDSNFGYIRKVTPTGDVSTVAGSGTSGFTDGQGSNAAFFYPAGSVFDVLGNLYLADPNNNAVRRVTPTGAVTTFAGNGSSGSVDGRGSAAAFRGPYGVATDADGNFFVTDLFANRIRKITPAGLVSTVGGTGQYASVDGPLAAASFYSPFGITFDKAGNMYVSDNGGHKVRKVSPTGMVTTIAGTGQQGFNNGDGNVATFKNITGLTIDHDKASLYVADGGNFSIRKIDLSGYTINKVLPAGLVFDPKTGVISGTPTTPSLPAIYTITAQNVFGTSTATVQIEVNDVNTSPPAVITFNPIATKSQCDPDFPTLASSTNTGTPITYTSDNPSVATISATGIIHIVGPGVVTITASQAAGGAFTAATPVSRPFNVVATTPLQVNITTNANLICEGMEVTYTAGVANSSSPLNYTWQVNGIPAGQNSATFASTTLKKNDVITCRVTSTDACARTGLSNAISIDVLAYTTPTIFITQDNTAAICEGNPASFTATITNGGTNPQYQWMVNNVNAGDNTATFVNSRLLNGDVVTCMLSNQGGACLTTLFATSNILTPAIISSPAALPSVVITASANDIYPNTSVTFTAVTSDAGTQVTYQWQVNGNNAGNNSPTFTTSQLKNGDIVNCVITSSIPCTPSTSGSDIRMNVLPPLAIKVMNAFTPNGDGFNDTWNLPDLVAYPNCLVSIFNRAGQLLLQSTGYNKPWDGNYNGKASPAGVYFYIIDTRDGQPKLSGNVTLIR